MTEPAKPEERCPEAAQLRGFVPKRTTNFQQHQRRIELLILEGMHDGKAWKPEAFARYNELETLEGVPEFVSKAEPDPRDERLPTFDVYIRMVEKLEAAEAERDRLVEALRKYGSHELVDGVRYCPYFDNKPCTCGLESVLSDYDKAAEVKK